MSFSLSPQHLQERLNNGESLFLLDVREPEEYAIAHLPNAHLIPLSTLPRALNTLEENIPIIAYCHHGVRSAHAVLYLMQQGFTNVQNLEGGIDAWSRLIDPSVPRY